MNTESGREEVSFSYEGPQQEESARLLGMSEGAIVSAKNTTSAQKQERKQVWWGQSVGVKKCEQPQHEEPQEEESTRLLGMSEGAIVSG